MKKKHLILILKFAIVFLAIVGFAQLIIGGIEFFTGQNPICSCK